MSFFPNPKVVRKDSGVVEYLVAKYGEASGQSYKAGQLVYLDSSSQVTAVASDGQMVLGIAQTAATGTQATEATIEVIRPEDEVEIVCSTTVAATNHLKRYANVVASNVCKLDLSDTSNDCWFVKAPVLDATGGYTTKAIVTLLPACAQILVGVT